MKIKDVSKIVLCDLECILLPNGEIISLGKTIGYLKDFELALTPKFKALKKK